MQNFQFHFFPNESLFEIWLSSFPQEWPCKSCLSFPHHCQSLVALFQPDNQNDQSRFVTGFLPVLPNFRHFCTCCESRRGSCRPLHRVSAPPCRAGEQPPAAGPVSGSWGRGSSSSLLCPVVPGNQAGEKYILKYTRQKKNRYRNTYNTRQAREIYGSGCEPWSYDWAQLHLEWAELAASATKNCVKDGIANFFSTGARPPYSSDVEFPLSSFRPHLNCLDQTDPALLDFLRNELIWPPFPEESKASNLNASKW